MLPRFWVLKLILLSVFCTFLWLPAAARADEQSMEDGLDWVEEPMKEDVKERVNKGIEDYENKVDELEPLIKQRMDEYRDSGEYTVKGENFPEQPKRHPLLDTPKKGVAKTSKEDYTEKDTKVIFNTETFGQCLEERQILPKDGDPYFEECKKRCVPGWVTYTGEATTSCHPCTEPCIPFLNPRCVPCKYNQLYVSEIYWPVFESRTYPARAMGSFDPEGDYLAKPDQRSEYEYDLVRREAYDRHIKLLKEWYEEAYNKQISESELKKAFPKDLYLGADYTGRDLNTGEGNPTDVQSNHTLVYMTNANRQLSRRFRPGKANNWKGYVMEDKCFFNTLPDADRRAVSHASYDEGHEPVTYQYHHREISEPSGVKSRGTAYGHAMLDKSNVYEVARLIDQELKQDPGKQPKSTTNKMLGQYIEMNQGYYKKGMERIGAELDTHYQDWLYHNFFRLYHTRDKEMLEDPLYGKIVAGFSFYTLNSLPTFEPNLDQDGKRRPILWSFWAGRPGMDGQNYAGSKKVGPGKIFSADKIQVIYPTLEDKDRGSSCFKPESLAKGEYVDIYNQTIDDRVGTQNFWGFRRDLYKRLLEKGIEDAQTYVREVRIAYWKKRVNCHCTICAKDGFLGCSVLNDGDHPDDWFYGTRSLEDNKPILYPKDPLRVPVTEWRLLK